MRTILAAMILTVPLAAQAQQAPAPVLERTLGECVRTCSESNSYPFCADVCGCMTGEIGRHWTDQDLVTRMTRLSKNPDDAMVRSEMSRIAQYCARRGQ